MQWRIVLDHTVQLLYYHSDACILSINFVLLLLFIYYPQHCTSRIDFLGKSSFFFFLHTKKRVWDFIWMNWWVRNKNIVLCFLVLTALNSKLFPEGSLKNMVYCSPGCPSNLKCGSIINLMPFCFNLSANEWNCSTVNAKPACGTGTSSPFVDCV